MMTTELIIYGVLLTAVIAAGITDVLSSRVPNYITFPLALIGLGFHAFSDSGAGILFSFAGLGLGLALLLGFYVYGGMGAGDVKLLAAVGAIVGPFNVFVGFLIATMLGGLYAVAVMIWHLGLPRTAERITTLFVTLVFMKTNVAASLEETALPKLRYALVIGLGTLIGQGYQWSQAI